MTPVDPAHLLHDFSTRLIQADDLRVLFDATLDTAVALMGADLGTFQTFHADRGEHGMLELVGARGFTDEARRHFAWVSPESSCVCGQAFARSRRVVVADVTDCDFLRGSDDLAILLGAGIRAVQSTPLMSRSGALLGMLTTHWNRPHAPGDDELRLLDILARQASDLIERRRTEEALRASEAALRDVDRRKDEFLAMLGHELRNPLAPIVTALELMRLRGVDLTMAREHAIISRQVTHLMRLVDDLLDVSRITRGKITLTRAPVELGKIVANAYEAVAPLIEQRSHRVELMVPPRGMLIHADEMRFSQVVTNLLSNAAKYTDSGGRIAIEARRDRDSIKLSVSDNGVGITAEVLPRVFDVFVQESQGADRSRGGLGLGLTIVKRLVEAHGGTVRAESEGRSRGSTFVVEVPAAEAELLS